MRSSWQRAVSSGGEHSGSHGPHRSESVVQGCSVGNLVHSGFGGIRQSAALLQAVTVVSGCDLRSEYCAFRISAQPPGQSASNEGFLREQWTVRGTRREASWIRGDQPPGIRRLDSRPFRGQGSPWRIMAARDDANGPMGTERRSEAETLERVGLFAATRDNQLGRARA